MPRVWSGAAVLVVVLALCLVLPQLYANQFLFFDLMVYLALAQGVNILYGFTGYLPFGYVGFFGTGAYGMSLAVLKLHLPPVPAALAGGVAAVVLGLVLAPLLRLSGAYFAIASLAASQAVYYVVANPSLTGVTRGPYGISLARVYHPSQSYLVMVGVLGLTLAAVLYLRRSRRGMVLQAIRDDPQSAAMAGVNVVRERVLAWLASALIAGLVGGVFAWQISVFYPATVFDLSTSIMAIVFTLFGGTGTLLGPVLGVTVLFGLYNVIGVSEPQYFQLIYGALIVLLVLFLPGGAASLLKRRGIDVL